MVGRAASAGVVAQSAELAASEQTGLLSNQQGRVAINREVGNTQPTLCKGGGGAGTQRTCPVFLVSPNGSPARDEAAHQLQVQERRSQVATKLRSRAKTLTFTLHRSGKSCF